MACEPDVALLITASGSFVNKHKLPHIKKKDLRTKYFKSEDLFLRDHYGFKTKIEKSESIVNNINSTSQKKVCLQTNFCPNTYSQKLEKHCWLSWKYIKNL